MLEALTCCLHPDSDTAPTRYAQPSPPSAASQGKKPTFACYRIKTGHSETLTLNSDESEFSALLPGKQLRVARRVDTLTGYEEDTGNKCIQTKTRIFWDQDKCLYERRANTEGSRLHTADLRLEMNKETITASLIKEKERARKQQQDHHAVMTPSRWSPNYMDIKYHRETKRLVNSVAVERLQCPGADRRYLSPTQTIETTGAVRTAVVAAQTRKKGQDTPTATAIKMHDKICPLVGVFDGHGDWGATCSREVARKLPEELQKRLLAFSRTMVPQAAVMNALKTSFVAVDRNLVYSAATGSTACLALIDDHTVTVANVGDSRAVLMRRVSVVNGRFEAEQLSTDQKTLYPPLAKSMEKRRGRVSIPDTYRLHPGAVTRKFGDASASGLSARPKISQTSLTENDYLVIASDGVWDYLLPEHMAVLIARLHEAGYKTPEEIAQKILAFVRRAQDQCCGARLPISPDDLSVTVTQLHTETEV